jgi:uncharacterized protein YihD (DUF1040 family)
MSKDLKIIQIVPCPNDATWQGTLFGLGSDGVIYEAKMKDSKWVWITAIPLNFELIALGESK